MSAVAVQIEEALVARLKAAVLAGDVSQPFEPTNEPQSQYSAEELDECRVCVLTTAYQNEPQTRVTDLRVVTVEIGVVKRIGFTDGKINKSGREDMMTLAEQIKDLMAEPLEGFEKCGPREPQIAFDLDPVWLRQGIIAFGVAADYVTTSIRRAA